MLKKLTIKEYRGFFEEQSITLATPNNEDAGSGLTVLVGPNNTGKTTVIESMLINTEKRFSKPDRHGETPPEITLENTDSNKTTFTNIDKGSQVKITGESKTHGLQFELIPSRRYWQTYSGGESAVSGLMGSSTHHSTRGPGGELDLAATLKSINKDKSQKDKFNGYLKKLIPNFTGWTIDTDEKSDYVKYKTATAEHHASLSGDGIISVFRLCAHFTAPQNSVFIIDEPELSLHPFAQKALSKLISELSKDRQIILCTHSPHFVNWSDFANGAQFVRLNKPNDKQCEISSLDRNKKYAKFIANNFTEWQKPQLLDYVAKEVFFTDKILFTEGQQDVGLIKKWLHDNGKDINFDIFGYGAGSYSNIKLFLELASDLGLCKVAALYDNGTESSKEYTKAKSDYSDYHLEILPTNDIRDKQDAEGAIKTEGCFDKSGNLKPDHKIAFETIMENIISYMDS